MASTSPVPLRFAFSCRLCASAERTLKLVTKRLLAVVAGVFAVGVGQSQAGTIQSFTAIYGPMRPSSRAGRLHTRRGDSDSDFAQWAAVERDFTVRLSSMVQAITFSYGGGVNGNGLAISPGGFEPDLSLFDAPGLFLASTFFGATCPPGANTNMGSVQCSMSGSTQVSSGPALTPLPLARSKICRSRRIRVWAVWRTDLPGSATWLKVRICTSLLTWFFRMRSVLGPVALESGSDGSRVCLR